MSFTRVDLAKAGELIQAGAQIVDTRDEASFLHAHVKGALSLARVGVNGLLNHLDQQQPVLVYCYHGMSSQQVAAYLGQMGFSSVYSMDGGFEHWRVSQPVVSGNE